MTREPIKQQLPKFLLVGALGFLTDLGLFTALLWSGIMPIPGRLVSAAAAISLTWYLNRLHVFRTATVSARGPEYLRYWLVQTVGLSVNLGSFIWLVRTVGTFRDQPVLALCVGAILAIGLNFLGARYWAYRTIRRT